MSCVANSEFSPPPPPRWKSINLTSFGAIYWKKKIFRYRSGGGLLINIMLYNSEKRLHKNRKTNIYNRIYDTCFVFITPHLSFEVVYCFCCRQKVDVTRHRMICLSTFHFYNNSINTKSVSLIFFLQQCCFFACEEREPGIEPGSHRVVFKSPSPAPDMLKRRTFLYMYIV